MASEHLRNCSTYLNKGMRLDQELSDARGDLALAKKARRDAENSFSMEAEHLDAIREAEDRVALVTAKVKANARIIRNIRGAK